MFRTKKNLKNEISALKKEINRLQDDNLFKDKQIEILKIQISMADIKESLYYCMDKDGQVAIINKYVGEELKEDGKVEGKNTTTKID